MSAAPCRYICKAFAFSTGYIKANITKLILLNASYFNNANGFPIAGSECLLLTNAGEHFFFCLPVA